MRKKLKKIKKALFKDYSTDTALRYLPVVDLFKKNKLANNKILEVGSGDLGITPYLKKKITGLDITFGSQENGLLQKVKYNGGRFPFVDNEFDVVISVDSLEHVPKSMRQEFIKKMVRVASKAVVIVVPCGAQAHKHDKELARYFYKIHNYHDKFLSEHINNDLSEANEIIEMIKTAARKINKNVIIGQQKRLLNIKVRKIILKCKISRNVILSILYYLFLFLLPFRNYLNFGNCYRVLFYVKIK